MYRIKSFTILNTEFYNIALQIRHVVFVQEQQVPEGLEIENEDQATYYLIFENDLALGVGRWRKSPLGIKLERFAILPQYRNMGIGSILLKQVLDDLKNEESAIYLHSQIQVVPYYQKVGFVIDGELFEEAGIKHYKMYLKNRKLSI
jgi:predicted GNAT family N-acyltransferase